jgi:hypothetical protein
VQRAVFRQIRFFLAKIVIIRVTLIVLRLRKDTGTDILPHQ